MTSARAKIKPNPARKYLVISNVADMVFAVQAFRERLGVRNRNRLAHCVGLAAKQVERSNIWSAEEPLCHRYFVRGQIGIVEERLS
jgi:hypothetical protein